MLPELRTVLETSRHFLRLFVPTTKQVSEAISKNLNAGRQSPASSLFLDSQVTHRVKRNYVGTFTLHPMSSQSSHNTSSSWREDLWESDASTTANEPCSRTQDF